LGQRSRKRGRREKAAATATAAPPRVSRSEQRNAEVRATLTPYAPGERPWSIKIGAVVAALVGGVQLVLFLAHVKLKVAGTQAKAGQTIVFGIVMFVCAGGVWLMRYWAVLGFMALLGLMILYFALALVKVSSLLGLGIAVGGLASGGLLFYKLVRVLSRIQMPRYPGR
jgi:uncharacterized protein YhhL (DUF1145 family)